MTSLNDIGLFVLQRPSRSNENLLFDQVESNDLFGDGVLHLQSGVHLQKIVVALSVHQKFDRPGTDITDRFGCSDCRCPHALSQFVRQKGRGTLLDYLLMATLDRALPIVQMEDIAMLISQDLKLYVMRLFDVFFDIDRCVAKGG